MSRNNSIGYIPPTPFRDDSDVFVLPPVNEEPAPSGPGPHPPGTAPSAELQHELEVIHALRIELKQRHSEITARIQNLLHSQLSASGSLNRPGGSKQFKLTGIPPAIPEQPAPGSSPENSTENSTVSSELNPAAANESDRLALLKAQLADRIRAMQSRTETPAAEMPLFRTQDMGGLAP